MNRILDFSKMNNVIMSSWLTMISKLNLIFVHFEIKYKTILITILTQLSLSCVLRMNV
jgi:hypothetical protein